MRESDSLEIDLLEPNKHRLDEEWAQQTKLFAQVADQLNEARTLLEHAQIELKIVEEELKEIEAEIELEIRRAGPGNYGLEKLTESSVQALITTNPKCKQYKKKVMEAKEHVVDMKGIVAGWEVKADAVSYHRKPALENLVILHGRDYFSEPSIPIGEGGNRLKRENQKRVEKMGQYKPVKKERENGV